MRQHIAMAAAASGHDSMHLSTSPGRDRPSPLVGNNQHLTIVTSTDPTPHHLQVNVNNSQVSGGRRASQHALGSLFSAVGFDFGVVVDVWVGFWHVFALLVLGCDAAEIDVLNGCCFIVSGIFFYMCFCMHVYVCAENTYTHAWCTGKSGYQ